jgi:hypothetical protein
MKACVLGNGARKRDLVLLATDGIGVRRHYQ